MCQILDFMFTKNVLNSNTTVFVDVDFLSLAVLRDTIFMWFAFCKYNVDGYYGYKECSRFCIVFFFIFGALYR